MLNSRPTTDATAIALEPLKEQSEPLGYHWADFGRDVEVGICYKQTDDLADEEGVAVRPRINPVNERVGSGDVAEAATRSAT